MTERSVPVPAAGGVGKWSSFYAASFAPWDSGRPASQLVAFLRDHPDGQRLLAAPARVLEVGCGTGASCVWMAQQGMSVVGVDFVAQPLAAASAAAAAAGVADRCVFVTADFMALPDAFSFAQAERTAKADGGGEDHADEEPPGFDLLYDCQCFHVLRKEVGEQPVVDKMAKLVRQGGKLLLHLDSSTTCLADDRILFTLVGNCNEEMTGPERLTRDELANAFAAARFEALAIYETRFDMTEHYRRTLPRPPLAWCGIFKKL